MEIASLKSSHHANNDINQKLDVSAQFIQLHSTPIPFQFLFNL